MVNHKNGPLLLIAKLLIINLVNVVAIMMTISKYNKKGLIKTILFVVSLTDFLFSFRSESTLLMAVAIILMSPQELGQIFPTFSVMVFFEQEQDSHVSNLILLCLIFAHAYLSKGFMEASQTIFQEEHSLKFKSESDRSHLIIPSPEASNLQNTIRKLSKSCQKYFSVVQLAMLGLATVSVLCTITAKLLPRGHGGQETSMLEQLANLVRWTYFLVALVSSGMLLIKHYCTNCESKGKHY
jgi:hypothetical protein